MSRRLETLGTLSLNTSTANVTTDATATRVVYTWDNVDWVTVFANRAGATDLILCEHQFECSNIRWIGNTTFTNRVVGVGTYQTVLMTSNFPTRSAITGNSGSLLNIAFQKVTDVSIWRPPNQNSMVYFLHECTVAKRRVSVITTPQSNQVSITCTVSQPISASGTGINDILLAGVHSFTFYILRN